MLTLNAGFRRISVCSQVEQRIQGRQALSWFCCARVCSSFLHHLVFQFAFFFVLPLSAVCSPRSCLALYFFFLWFFTHFSLGIFLLILFFLPTFSWMHHISFLDVFLFLSFISFISALVVIPPVKHPYLVFSCNLLAYSLILLSVCAFFVGPYLLLLSVFSVVFCLCVCAQDAACCWIAPPSPALHLCITFSPPVPLCSILPGLLSTSPSE